MQLGFVSNQLSFQQGINNQPFDQKIERNRISLLNVEKSLSCSPVKNVKKKDKREQDVTEMGYVNENTLSAICSNLKLFYELELEQSTIHLNQQINNLQMNYQKQKTQEDILICELRRAKGKVEQIQIEYEMQIKELNHKYKYEMELFKCQTESQINDYSIQLAEVITKNTHLLDIFSVDYQLCQKYKALFKDYKNGLAYQEAITKNINQTNEIRIMKVDMQILQQDNSNYVDQITKLTKKVNLFQKLNEERQQELIEKDNIIQLYEQQNEQMQVQYKLSMQTFSENMLSLLKQKDNIQQEIVQRLQNEIAESNTQRKSLIKKESVLEENLQQLNCNMREQVYLQEEQNEKIAKLEQQIKHLVEEHAHEVYTMRSDTQQLIKLHEKNSIATKSQHNTNVQNINNYYEQLLTDWKNNYYKVSQKLCELEQNITNGPKYYLQKAYEDYQQNVQRTVQASESKMQDIMMHSIKLQDKINHSTNETQILKEQIIELKDKCQNNISTLHNSQRECLAAQEKAKQIKMIHQEQQNELQQLKAKLAREQECRHLIERESADSQSRLESQVQNLKREIMTLTQQIKPNYLNLPINANTSLKVDKIGLNTMNKLTVQNNNNSQNIINNISTNQSNMINNQSIMINNQSIMNTTVIQNQNQIQAAYAFNTTGLHQQSQQSESKNSQNEQIQLISQFQQTQKFPLQNSIVKKQFQQQQNNIQNNSNNNTDTWQIQQFCYKMIGEFQIKFDQQMNIIKENMDKQYHNALFKEVKLTIEKDARVLDLPFEEKKKFTLKATDYFGIIIEGRMKDLKIEMLIHDISSLMKYELKEKVNLSLQLEKALKENITLQKASQNRIGNESEDFKNILQNQISKLFQNIKDIDTQKLHQIEIRQIEHTIKNELQTTFETKLNNELEDNKRFIEDMKGEYYNLIKLHEQHIRDITINLGAEIAFLQSQLEKKITQAALFSHNGNIDDASYPIQSETNASRQIAHLSNTTQNFPKSSSCSFNKENHQKLTLSQNNQIQINTPSSIPAVNSLIPITIQEPSSSSSQANRFIQKIGMKQLTVSQHISANGEVSTLPSSSSKHPINIYNRNQVQSSNGIDRQLSTSSTNSKIQEMFGLSKPSLSYSFDVSKELQYPTSSDKSDTQIKRNNKIKHLYQSVDVLEGIKEEKQNKLRHFLNEDILDLNSSMQHNNNSSFNDSELRRTYQHFILPSKSVEPGVNRTQQNNLGTKKNLLNQTLSVLKDLQSSSKSNGRKLNLGQRNTIHSQSPSVSINNNNNNKSQLWQNLKHFNQQSTQHRQKMKLSQLALITNEAINIGLQQPGSNNPFISSKSKQL